MSGSTSSSASKIPRNLPGKLRADRQAITDANQHNESEVRDGVENTELIGQLLGQARHQVIELDAILHNK